MHKHEFIPAYWLRAFGVAVQVPASSVSTVREPDGWMCRCGEQGYLIPA